MRIFYFILIVIFISHILALDSLSAEEALDAQKLQHLRLSLIMISRQQNSETCDDANTVFTDFQKETYSAIKTFVVDCDKSLEGTNTQIFFPDISQWCSDNDQLPKIVFFQSTNESQISNNVRPNVLYTEEITLKGLLKKADNLLKNDRHFFSEIRNYKAWIHEQISCKILLVNDKEETPMAYKMLENEFADYADFGEVNTNNTSYLKTFQWKDKEKKWPKIVLSVYFEERMRYEDHDYNYIGSIDKKLKYKNLRDWVIGLLKDQHEKKISNFDEIQKKQDERHREMMHPGGPRGRPRFSDHPEEGQEVKPRKAKKRFERKSDL